MFILLFLFHDRPLSETAGLVEFLRRLPPLHSYPESMVLLPLYSIERAKEASYGSLSEARKQFMG
jgi:hypothetical protein